MTLQQLLASTTLALAIGACSKGNADLDAFMKLDTDKAAAFAAGGDDCVAKAKSVGEWRKAHTAEYKVLQKKLNEQWPKGPPKDVEDKYGDRIKANKKAVVGAMMACANDDAFGKMMDETTDR